MYHGLQPAVSSVSWTVDHTSSITHQSFTLVPNCTAKWQVDVCEQLVWVVTQRFTWSHQMRVIPEAHSLHLPTEGWPGWVDMGDRLDWDKFLTPGLATRYSHPCRDQDVSNAVTNYTNCPNHYTTMPSLITTQVISMLPVLGQQSGRQQQKPRPHSQTQLLEDIWWSA